MISLTVPSFPRHLRVAALALIPIVLAASLTQGQDAYNNALNRAFAEKANGDLKGAIADFTKAIKIRPDDAAVYNDRGLAEYAKGDWKSAIADFSKVIDLKPDYAAAYNNRAAAKYAKGDFFGSRVDEAKAAGLREKAPSPGQGGMDEPQLPDIAWNAINGLSIRIGVVGDKPAPDISLATCPESQPFRKGAYRAYAGCARPQDQIAVLLLKGTRATYVDGISAFNVPQQGKAKSEYLVDSSDSLELLPGRHTIRFVRFNFDLGLTPQEHMAISPETLISGSSRNDFIEELLDAEPGKTYTALWRTQYTGHIATAPDHNVVQDQRQFWVEISEFKDDPASYLRSYEAHLKSGDSAAALSALENHLVLFPKDPAHKSVEQTARKLRAELDKAQLDAYRTANSGPKGRGNQAIASSPPPRGCQTQDPRPQERTAAPLTVKTKPNQAQPDLKQVLSRAARYVEEYEGQLGNLISQEVYVQDVLPARPGQFVTMSPGARSQHQRTESDFAILQVGQDWLGLREVHCVDGLAVERQGEAFDKVLGDSPAEQTIAIDNILRGNAQYNIGPIYRNANLPTFVLRIMHPDNVPRFEFKEAGETTVGGIRTLAVDYQEVQGPSLIRGLYDHSEFAHGTLWIEPDTGRILKTEMNIAGREDANSFTWQSVVSYKYNPKLQMLVPVSMEEHYDRNGVRSLDCRADYLNFRRFQVETHLDFGPQLRPDGGSPEPAPRCPGQTSSTFQSTEGQHSIFPGERVKGLGYAGKIHLCCLLGLVPIVYGQVDPVSRLILELKDPNPTVRGGAAIALGESRDSRAVEPLLYLLIGQRGERDGDREVLRDAATALGEIKDPRTVKRLIDVLKDDPDLFVRSLAAVTLGQIKDARAVEPLSAALLTDTKRARDEGRDPQVQQSAATALGQIEDPRVVAPLIAALKDANSDVRVTAVTVLGQVKDPRVIDSLIRAVDDADPEVRGTLFTILGQSGDPRTIPPLIAGLKDANPEVQQRAGAALAAIGEPAVQPLIAALNGTDPVLQSLAGAALVRLGIPEIVNPLIASLNTTNPAARKATATALGDIQDPRAMESLLALLKDTDSEVRATTATTLGQIGDPRAVEPLIAALTDTNSEVRKDAANALGQIQTPEVVEPLIALLKDPDSEVRVTAAAVLGQIEDPRSVDALIACLKDVDAHVQQQASGALRAMGTPAIEPLITAMKDADHDVQRLAGNVLMLMKTGVVAVAPDTLAFINALGTGFVFFTSWDHPLVRLTDITDSGSQFAVAESTPQLTLISQLFGSGSAPGGFPPIEIGKDSFGGLFQNHPQLKLFVVAQGTAGIHAIENTGRGLQIRFVESR